MKDRFDLRLHFRYRFRKEKRKRSKASEEMLSEFLRSGTSLNLLKLEKEVLLCCPVLSKVS